MSISIMVEIPLREEPLAQQPQRTHCTCDPSLAAAPSLLSQWSIWHAIVPQSLTAVTVVVVLFYLSAILPSRLSPWRLMFLLLERERNRVSNDRRPRRIILIRHGESEGNSDPDYYAHTPDNQVPLTEKGREQSRRCGEELRNLLSCRGREADAKTCIRRQETAHFYVSPFLRAVQTFEEISKSLAPNSYTWMEEPRLREQEWGNLLTQADQNKACQDRARVGRFFYRFENGESGADVYDRVSVFLETLFRSFTTSKDRFPAENYVLVSHGLLIRLFLARYYHWSVADFERIENLKNCEMVVMEKCNRSGKYVIASDLRWEAECPAMQSLGSHGVLAPPTPSCRYKSDSQAATGMSSNCEPCLLHADDSSNDGDDDDDDAKAPSSSSASVTAAAPRRRRGMSELRAPLPTPTAPATGPHS